MAARPLALAAAALLVVLSGCPVARHPPPAPVRSACSELRADPAALRADVEKLALAFLPRDFDHPANLDAAAAWIASRLRAEGIADVGEQTFQVDGRTYRNVIARVGPDTPERIVVGAHYDAAGPLPGADDDASGVAGLLAVAHALAAHPPPLRVELAAYALEEPPAFGTADMGSAAHARALRAEDAKVRLMISIEMIGTFDDAPGSQRYPVPTKKLLYPDKGNFISVVGHDGGLVAEVAGAIQAASTVPVETLAAPGGVPGIDLSDHRSFWDAGYPAVMVTDTAFYRNRRYHTAQDLPDRLDYPRMAQVAQGLACAVQAVASRPAR